MDHDHVATDEHHANQDQHTASLLWGRETGPEFTYFAISRRAVRKFRFAPRAVATQNPFISFDRRASSIAVRIVASQRAATWAGLSERTSDIFGLRFGLASLTTRYNLNASV